MLLDRRDPLKRVIDLLAIPGHVLKLLPQVISGAAHPANASAHQAGPRCATRPIPCAQFSEAVTDYHLGYPLTEVSARLKVQRSLRVSPSTIATWLADHREHTSYHRLRARGKNLFSPTTTIRAIKLYHRQVYEFAYYRPKLTLLRQGALDEKRRRDAHFASLAETSSKRPAKLPACALSRQRKPSSQVKNELFDPRRIIVNTKGNAATRAAALILPTVGDNYLRHPRLQRFMLANDSVTVAVEIPIYPANRSRHFRHRGHT